MTVASASHCALASLCEQLCWQEVLHGKEKYSPSIQKDERQEADPEHQSASDLFASRVSFAGPSSRSSWPTIWYTETGTKSSPTFEHVVPMWMHLSARRRRRQRPPGSPRISAHAGAQKPTASFQFIPVTSSLWPPFNGAPVSSESYASSRSEIADSPKSNADSSGLESGADASRLCWDAMTAFRAAAEAEARVAGRHGFSEELMRLNAIRPASEARRQLISLGNARAHGAQSISPRNMVAVCRNMTLGSVSPKVAASASTDLPDRLCEGGTRGQLSPLYGAPPMILGVPPLSVTPHQ